MDEVKKYIKKNDIFYKPELDYEKHYDTSGEVTDEIGPIEKDYDYSLVDKLNNKIADIEKILPLLPDDLKSVIKNPLDPIKYIIGEIPDELKRPTIMNEEISVNDIPDIDRGDEVPSSPFRDDDEVIDINVVVRDKTEFIKDEYRYDLASIIADYIDKLNLATGTIMKNILVSVGRTPSSFGKLVTPFKVNSSILQENHKHLADLITRSQIIRDQRVRLYNKMFDIDETIMHIINCKAGVEQKIRYYNAEYANENNFNDIVSNKILEVSRASYDKKYEENFFNLYKYLNGSVIVLTESLNMYVNEIQAKTILLEKEGNDLW